MLWKALDTNSEYEVSDTGLIRKVHMMKTFIDRDGYERVGIRENGKPRQTGIHRLVLHAFDPRENEKDLEVHHIDGNPLNNNLENLMWCTHEENIRHIKPETRNSEWRFISRPVVQMTAEGEEIAIYPSAREAWRQHGFNPRHISDVCQGKRHTTGGFRWKYLEGSTTNCSSECCETENSVDENGEDIV